MDKWERLVTDIMREKKRNRKRARTEHRVQKERDLVWRKTSLKWQGPNLGA
jgi:hypothetical protein